MLVIAQLIDLFTLPMAYGGDGREERNRAASDQKEGAAKEACKEDQEAGTDRQGAAVRAAGLFVERFGCFCLRAFVDAALCGDQPADDTLHDLGSASFGRDTQGLGVDGRDCAGDGAVCCRG